MIESSISVVIFAAWNLSKRRNLSVQGRAQPNGVRDSVGVELPVPFTPLKVDVKWCIATSTDD